MYTINRVRCQESTNRGDGPWHPGIEYGLFGTAGRGQQVGKRFRPGRRLWNRPSGARCRLGRPGDTSKPSIVPRIPTRRSYGLWPCRSRSATSATRSRGQSLVKSPHHPLSPWERVRAESRERHATQDLRIKKARCLPVRCRPATGFHHGNLPDASCGVPVRTPSTRQSNQTS